MRYVLSLFVLLSLSTVAFAQETPKVEIFGGVSGLFADIKGYDKSIDMDGLNISAIYNLHPNFGIKADFGGHFKTEQEIGPGERIDMKHYSYLFGPQLTHRGRRFTFYTHALIGVVHNTFSNYQKNPVVLSSNDQFALRYTSSESGNGFGAALGGGVDLNLNKTIAIRLIQIDAVMGRYNGEYIGFEKDSYRYGRGSIGVVFKFGK